MGNVLSVSDLLLEWEQVDETYSWFTSKRESDEVIDASMDDMIKFLETMGE